jgi:hypothetical protein
MGVGAVSSIEQRFYWNCIFPHAAALLDPVSHFSAVDSVHTRTRIRIAAHTC